MPEDKKQPWNVFIPEGEGKGAKFHPVGIAWPIRDGGFSVEIPPGVILDTRKLVILPRKEKSAE